MRVKSLQVFCQLVQTGSVAEAARRSALSVSSVNRHVGALEARYGQRLVHRSPGDLTLTEAGFLLFMGACDVVERLRRLELAVHQGES